MIRQCYLHRRSQVESRRANVATFLRWVLWRVWACVSILGILATPVFSEDLRKASSANALPVEAVLSARSFLREAPSLSPDGQRIAYALQEPAKLAAVVSGTQYFTESGVPVEVTGADVWMTDLKTGDSLNLTEGKASSWGPVWSPNGRYLAFYSDRSGKPQIWVYDNIARSIRQVSDVVVHPAGGSELVRWTSDGKRS